MFQYMSLRKENQESHYNMGRAFHQIGLVHFATFYYNKALEFPMHNEKESNKAEYHPFIDLHREAACNLAMIYKASGNIELAKKHCTNIAGFKNVIINFLSNMTHALNNCC
ncbi:general transcription factor 3C polypeptide 3-like [Hydra vulgaris]|uniref:general transcription factor 3C polypeptide 3-like n=1 Tax=Hydra vulgaris TaxID=6087 RepID=UPI0032EA0484